MKNKTIKTLIFVFLSLFVVGVFLLAMSFVQDTNNTIKFIYISMSVIGFMSFSICMTNLIYQNKFKNKNEIANSSQKKAVPFFVRKVKKIKNKKITCPNCKCKYEETLSRCPNCGAPPNF